MLVLRWLFFMFTQIYFTESRFGMTRAVPAAVFHIKHKPNHWYNGVTDPIYDDEPKIASVKEGQLAYELPFTKPHRQHYSYTKPAGHKNVVLPVHNKIRKHSRKQGDNSALHFIKENGYAPADFGLSENGVSANENVPVYTDSADEENLNGYMRELEDMIGSVVKSHKPLTRPTQASFSKVSPHSSHIKSQTSSEQSEKDGDYSKDTLKTYDDNSLNAKKQNLNQKRRQTLNQRNKRLARIANLINLIKQYSKSSRSQEAMEGRDINQEPPTLHQPAASLHHNQPTSSTEVPEDETASSEAEASSYDKMLRFAAKDETFKSGGLPNLDDFHNHKLVTVDTTTGAVYSKQNLPHYGVGIAETAGFKKASMTYIPKQAKVVDAKRRTTVSQKINKSMSHDRKTTKTKDATLRESLTKKIKGNLHFLKTSEMKVLQTKLERIKRKRKKMA